MRGLEEERGPRSRSRELSLTESKARLQNVDLVAKVGVEQNLPIENTQVIDSTSRQKRKNRENRGYLARIRHTDFLT